VRQGLDWVVALVALLVRWAKDVRSAGAVPQHCIIGMLKSWVYVGTGMFLQYFSKEFNQFLALNGSKRD